jgi:hypothetical protein
MRSITHARWFLTVLALMSSRSAISSLKSPAIVSSITWRWRAESGIEARLQPLQLGGVARGLPALLHCVADAGEQAPLVKRLLDDVEGADLDGRDRHVDVAVPGDQDDRGGETDSICSA